MVKDIDQNKFPTTLRSGYSRLGEYKEISGIVARQNELRKAIDEIVADLESHRTL